MLPLRHLLALLLLGLSVVGCGTTARTRERLDYLVKIGATKDQIVAEFGPPVSTTPGPQGEVAVFVPYSRNTTKTITRIVDGKAITETVTTVVPGKLRLVLTFVGGRLVNQSVMPNYQGEHAIVTVPSPPYPSAPDGSSRSASTGTGLVFTADGHCFTNHHVIQGATRLKVYLPWSRKELSATLISVDEANDLALLKVDGWKPADGAPATPPPLSVDYNVSAGEKVFTFGFPFSDTLSREAKYSSGDVSGLSGIADDKRLLHVSLPIQPGNSGGALVLSDGRVVGVMVSTLNSLAIFRRYNSLPQNVNFAIKIDYLRLLATNSGVKVPEDLMVVGSPIEHVKSHTVQVVGER